MRLLPTIALGVFVALLVSLAFFAGRRSSTHAAAAPETRVPVRDSLEPLAPPRSAALTAFTPNEHEYAPEEAPADVELAELDPALDSGLGAPEPELEPVAVIVRLREHSGAWVSARADELYARSEQHEDRRAESLDDGSLALRGLAPGRWWLEARVAGFARVSSEVVVRAERAPQAVELSLEPQRCVRIVVETPGGLALPAEATRHLDALATRSMPGESILAHIGDAGQPFCGLLLPRSELEADARELEPRVLGFVCPECDAPLWISLVIGNRVLATQRWSGESETCTFQFDPETSTTALAGLRLQLVDARDQQPLDSVLVGLKTGVRHKTSDKPRASDGRIEFQGLLPGLATLELLGSDYGLDPLHVELHAGRTLDLGNVLARAAGGGTLHLSCTAPSEIESFVCEWGAIEKAGQTPSQFQSVHERDVNGTLQLQLSSGLWHVRCSAVASVRGVPRNYASRPLLIKMNTADKHVSARLEPLATLLLLPAATPCRVTLLDPLAGGQANRTFSVDTLPAALQLPIGTWDIAIQSAKHTERRVRVGLTEAGEQVPLD